MGNLQRGLALVTATLLIGACSIREGPEPSAGPVVGSAFVVRVTNHNWHDMRVYVARAGSETILGRVPSLSSATFRLPPTLVGADGKVQLIAEAFASRETYVSPPVMVGAGQRLELTIQNNLPISNIVVGN